MKLPLLYSSVSLGMRHTGTSTPPPLRKRRPRSPPANPNGLILISGEFLSNRPIT
jgi:hypothetical protein